MTNTQRRPGGTARSTGGLRGSRLILPLIFACLCAVLPAGAQRYASPYDVTPGGGIGVTGVALLSGGLGLRASARFEGFTAEQVAQLRLEDVLLIDRLATRRRSRAASLVSDVVGYGATAMPFGLIASERVRDNAGDAGLMYGQVLLLNTGLTQLVKNTVRRPRPYNFNPAVPLTQKMVKDARRSFFSGHTSNAAANSFFTAQVYQDFYPERRGNGWVWASAALLPAVTGTTRVLSGNHYWTDVVVGYLVGAGVGVLVPALHRL